MGVGIGHVVTNVGGVYEAAKAKPKKELFTILYQK
jgi:hypothetical protein